LGAESALDLAFVVVVLAFVVLLVLVLPPEPLCLSLERSLRLLDAVLACFEGALPLLSPEDVFLVAALLLPLPAEALLTPPE